MNARNRYQVPRASVTDAILPSTAPVNVFLYVLLSLLLQVAWLVASIAVDRFFGFHAPVVVLICGAITSICIAAAVFGARHSRQFLVVERRRFVTGCFIAHWLVDGFPSIATRFVNGTMTFSQFALAIEATGVGLLLVWLTVRFAAPLVMPRAPRSIPPPFA